MSQQFDPSKLTRISELVTLIEKYHRYEVVGLENIPKAGRCMLAVSHSLATYDIMLLQNQIYKEHNRAARSLADRWFFKIKWMADFATSHGTIPGDPALARELLENEELICVAPGGMRESIRPSTQRYQIVWDKRRGFARLALETGTPIVLAACPKADDIFDIVETPIALPVYKKLKLPFALFRGIGPTPIPRPVHLVHYLSKPVKPPPLAKTESGRKKQLERFHKHIIDQMEVLIGQAVAHRPSNFEI